MKYAREALTTAAELSARFINDRHLPDKAIDVIDEAGAAQKILPKSKQKKVISKTEIEEIVAKIARIPAKNVSSDDRNALKTLDRDLKNVVFGQDRAIDALVSAIRMLGVVGDAALVRHDVVSVFFHVPKPRTSAAQCASMSARYAWPVTVAGPLGDGCATILRAAQPPK